jgi:rod shape-determining protein MreC
MLIFLFWRLDNVRVEAVRLVVIEKFVPNFNFLLAPFTMLQNIALDFRSYSNILELNRELNQEIQQLKYWKEQAIQWEAKYAKLLDLNNVKLDPKLLFISGVILADSGS